MRLILFTIYSFLLSIECSKCPESRKPHSTSCTVFYNCVNLPDGGYVWVPSKCTEGLIFQPYLRICVLPGDAWLCDTSFESSIVTKKYEIPELINPNETSYMGSTEDPLNFSELIDSSYTVDNIPDSLNQEMLTPYPLIEIEESMHDNSTHNISETSDVHYGYSQTQNDIKKQNIKNNYSMLHRLVHHLLIYKEITIPLELLASLSAPVPSKPSIEANEIPHNEPEFSKVNRHNILMSYLVHNYIQQNNLQNNIVTDIKLQSTTGTSKALKDEASGSMLNIDTSSSTSQRLAHILEDDSTIVLITDSNGYKKYLTTEQFRSMNYNIDSKFVQYIPCVKNIRMPNVTNCMKYYTCDPDMASVIEYTCPLSTAFNKHTRICNSEIYSACLEKQSEKEKNVSEETGNRFQIIVPEKNICTELGKTKDPTSESGYYICYSTDNSPNIKSMRMACPNSLIFCKNKKQCTTRRLCTL